MATELKTDSWHRYMLYHSDERYMRFETEEDRKQAAVAGKKFVMSAYPDVWTSDVDLVKRVRAFLGENFNWHDRLSKSGTDLEVVETLFEMVRSGSVIVIPEDAPRGSSIGVPQAQAKSSFWGVERYGETPFVSVKDRYLAQLERMNAEGLTGAETQAMMDDINAGFMDAMFRAVPLASAIVFSKAGWISKYGVPDLSGVGLDDDGIVDTETPLGGTQPFKYVEDTFSGHVMDIAARGVSAADEAECLAMYELDMEQCQFAHAIYSDPRTYALCKERAFANYQRCRGY